MVRQARPSDQINSEHQVGGMILNEGGKDIPDKRKQHYWKDGIQCELWTQMESIKHKCELLIKKEVLIKAVLYLIIIYSQGCVHGHAACDGFKCHGKNLVRGNHSIAVI